MSDFEQCPGSRPFDPQHPSCRTCTIRCISKNTAYLDKAATDIAELMMPGKKAVRSKMTKTEIEYGNMLEMQYHQKPQFEAVTFHLLNGHAYTPDWQIKLPDGNLLLVEVKARGRNGFRQPSYQRAKVMFDQSKLDYPMFQWQWAEKHNGEWSISDYPTVRPSDDCCLICGARLQSVIIRSSHEERNI